jgi:hypothetical protein
MFRQLRVHTWPHSPLTDSMLQIKPLTRLIFCSPLPEGKAMKQAQQWHWEQLLNTRRLWELCQQHCIVARLIPMTQLPLMISDSVLDVENRISTATATPPSSQTLHSTSHLESQCWDPFWPMVWCNLTSVMCRPQHWQVDLLMPSTKTVKILLRFCCPTTTDTSSPISLLRASALSRPSLPKGWVYMVEDVSIKTKAEVVNPNSYLMLNAPLTCLKCKH